MNKTNLAGEYRLTLLLLALTAVASVMTFVEIAAIGVELAEAGKWFSVITQLFFALVVAVLAYGFFVYLITRLGHLQRRANHRPTGRDELEAIHDRDSAPLAVLVPSYKEEAAIVRRTLMSAALQEYPRRQVVLLIDNEYRPDSLADAEALRVMRRLPEKLQTLFEGPATRFAQAEKDFIRRQSKGSFDPRTEALSLAQCYTVAAEWFDGEISRSRIVDHGDQLFVDAVLTWWRDSHRERAARMVSSADQDGIDHATARREYRRLGILFRVEFSSFERKRYANLSHEANKAMNLNSYLALMGKSFRAFHEAGERNIVLRQVSPGHDTLDFPDASLILTLDADSVLLPDYALRLAHVLATPGNERVAVVQTPYSAFPGAPGTLERIAGATTDIQFLVHQGFTRYNATFWVGANALLRRSALEDICTESEERGYRVRKYIQDRTVIEDTESSIDLADRGWTLVNYPQRLAYSATPVDFGSLLIQRRRWANGGLIILPKTLRYLFRGPYTWNKAAEGFFRVHYLTSIAMVNVALLVILFGSFERNSHIVWLLLCSLPYMAAYARDLVLCGYRWADFLRVYALNLLLVPVHLGGVLKSLHQAVTGGKTPFARTPKITGRTAAPGAYVITEYGLLAASLAMLGIKLSNGHWMSAGFSLTYALACGYAIFRFVGWRDSLIDVRLWLDALAGKQPAAPPPREILHGEWAGTLPHRSEDGQPAPVAPAGAATVSKLKIVARRV